MTIYEQIKEYLDDLDDDDLIEIHNEYCRASQNGDDEVFRMCEFDDLMCGLSPLEVVRRIDRDFSENDDYFYFDGYGEVCSASRVEDMPIYTSDIARYIERTGDDFGNSDIFEILFGEEDEEAV